MLSRIAVPALFLAMLPCVALAVQKPPAATRASSGAKRIDTFEDWTAATHPEGGVIVCYAFTKAKTSTPAILGRGEVVLTVTERPSGRDAVAISAGFAYPPGSAVSVQAAQTSLDFYTAARNAFARDGRAAVAAFERAGMLVAKSATPRNGQVTDEFSLRGFTAAYKAISKSCPPK